MGPTLALCLAAGMITAWSTLCSGNNDHPMLAPGTSCGYGYDVLYYGLDLRINPAERDIHGSNMIRFSPCSDLDSLRLDLYHQLLVDSVIFRGQTLLARRERNCFWVYFPRLLGKGIGEELRVYYHGSPMPAVKPPWEGGFVWDTDTAGNTWIGVACQGEGASLWWPCKDSPEDEPDSMGISITVPDTLQAVSNGRFNGDAWVYGGNKRYDWAVTYPVNIYNITLNIGRFEHLKDQYVRLAGTGTGADTLELDYYVLAYNREKASAHFLQVRNMLECFERYFGPYPFGRDGYKLVETPYWGMEHQSCISYGNDYQNNAWDFDFIIIHESAHEWWGNSLSAGSRSDLWLHESFATYAEALYVECTRGREASERYLESYRPLIKNTSPMIPPGGDGSPASQDQDIYYKGAWVLHTFRKMIDNDSAWFSLLVGLQRQYALAVISTKDFLDFVKRHTGQDYGWFFEVYLNHAALPVFEYSLSISGGLSTIRHRWNPGYQGFRMPVPVLLSDGVRALLYPSEKWQKRTFKAKNLLIDLSGLLANQVLIQP